MTNKDEGSYEARASADMANLVAPNPNFAEATRRFLMAMPIARHFGCDITDVAPGYSEITQPYRHELSFREGVLQAGSIGTLADMAGACACATMLPDCWTCATTDWTLKLLAPGIAEKLIARGRVLKHGGALSVAAADVFAVHSDQATLCATALVTVHNLRPPGRSSAP